ncbi:hypothetical protein D9M73_113590 [compost metagenome]
MQLAHDLTNTCMSHVQIDFAAQVTQVFIGLAVMPGDDLVACAVVTQGLAKRNVDVQGQRHDHGCGAAMALRQRLCIVIRGKGLDKAVRCRIGGITRPVQVKSAQQVGRNNTHELISLEECTLCRQISALALTCIKPSAVPHRHNLIYIMDSLRSRRMPPLSRKNDLNTNRTVHTAPKCSKKPSK